MIGILVVSNMRTSPVVDVNVERLDAQPIARQKRRPIRRVPNAERKHADQLVQT